MSSNPHLDRRLADFERQLELLAAELQELRWLVAGTPVARERPDMPAPAEAEERPDRSSNFVTYVT